MRGAATNRDLFAALEDIFFGALFIAPPDGGSV